MKAIFNILLAVTLLIFGAHLLGYLPSLDNSKNVGVSCIQTLPFGYSNINHNIYYTWFGKVGTSTQGKTYQTGHVFSRHVAVLGKCTDEQTADNKTVFYDQSQLYKVLGRQTTLCDLTSATVFTYSNDGVISDTSKYIKGIDCKTGLINFFGKYFIQYKKAIQKSAPTQSEYMASTKTTIWTFYPKR